MLYSSAMYSMDWPTAGRHGLVSAGYAVVIPGLATSLISRIYSEHSFLKMLCPATTIASGTIAFIIGTLGTRILNDTPQKSGQRATNMGLLCGITTALCSASMTFGYLIRPHC